MVGEHHPFLHEDGQGGVEEESGRRAPAQLLTSRCSGFLRLYEATAPAPKQFAPGATASGEILKIVHFWCCSGKLLRVPRSNCSGRFAGERADGRPSHQVGPRLLDDVWT